jgi:copper chaperone CopZ
MTTEKAIGEATVFAVEEMSCDHCAARVKKAILALRAESEVHVDLATGLVHVRPVVGDPESMTEAIAEAGYPARLADSAS